MAQQVPRDDLTCSFFGKTQHQVIKLIAGPGVSICSECIDLCNQIVEDEVGVGHASVLAQQARGDEAE